MSKEEREKLMKFQKEKELEERKLEKERKDKEEEEKKSQLLKKREEEKKKKEEILFKKQEESKESFVSLRENRLIISGCQNIYWMRKFNLQYKKFMAV